MFGREVVFKEIDRALFGLQIWYSGPKQSKINVIREVLTLYCVLIWYSYYKEWIRDS
jgi:hypothetical protein